MVLLTNFLILGLIEKIDQNVSHVQDIARNTDQHVTKMTKDLAKLELTDSFKKSKHFLFSFWFCMDSFCKL